MPYKDKQKSREAWNRWRLRNPLYWLRNKKYKSKPQEKEKNKIRTYSARKYKQREKCSIEGCGNIGERHHIKYEIDKIVWLCRKHHIEAHKKCG